MASSKTAGSPEGYDSISLSLGKANNDFGLRVHQNLAASDENVFFSPLSLSVAMSMLLRGTKEETTEEISKILGFHAVNLSANEIHRSFSDLMTAISSESEESYILAVANAFACHKTFKLIPEYRRDLEKLYKAATWEMDFGSGAGKVIDEINDWVKTNTRGMIANLLDTLDPSTVLILLNAVYFKGTWEHQFNAKRTRSKKFYNHGLDSNVKSVDMMSMRKTFPYMETSSYQALELPYKGDRIAMLLLLPKEKNGLIELETNLKGDLLSSVTENLHTLEVTVTLPKLHLEYSKGMKTVFRDLGLSTIFDQRVANFKGLSEEGGLEVSEILHKAVIDVNEEGSEAAAVTAVIMLELCLVDALEIRFIADHPFLFVIYDKRNNMIFFMGRVTEL